MKKLFVEAHFSSVSIQTQDEEVVAVFSGGGQPDLAVHHNRAGPATIRDGSLPFDVLRFAPVEREADEPGVAASRDMPVAPRPAKIRPIRFRSNRFAGGREQDRNGNEYTLERLAHQSKLAWPMSQVKEMNLS
jgi:hypothetical protein